MWFGRKELVKFGVEACYLSHSHATTLYETCLEALKESIGELEEYISQNENFKEIGSKMLETWKLSLDEKTYKEIPVEITRNWTKDKRA